MLFVGLRNQGREVAAFVALPRGWLKPPSPTLVQAELGWARLLMEKRVLSPLGNIQVLLGITKVQINVNPRISLPWKSTQLAALRNSPHSLCFVHRPWCHRMLSFLTVGHRYSVSEPTFLRRRLLSAINIMEICTEKFIIPSHPSSLSSSVLVSCCYCNK